MSDDPWYIVAFTLAMGFGMMGGFIMTVVPRDWQNLQGWLLVSYVGIPAFVVVLAVAVNAPGLLFGGLFVAGVLAMGR